MRWDGFHFSNFGSLKSTETDTGEMEEMCFEIDFSNFGSLKSTETWEAWFWYIERQGISAISAR